MSGSCVPERRRYAVADLATEATKQALHNSDVAQVVFTWWRDGTKLYALQAPAAHLPVDVPPAPAGATHLSVEERVL